MYLYINSKCIYRVQKRILPVRLGPRGGTGDASEATRETIQSDRRAAKFNLYRCTANTMSTNMSAKKKKTNANARSTALKWNKFGSRRFIACKTLFMGAAATRIKTRTARKCKRKGKIGKLRKRTCSLRIYKKKIKK